MNLATFQANEFPAAHGTLVERLDGVEDSKLEGLVIFGGSARNSLLEAVEGIERPIRDVDLAAIGDGCSDEAYRAVHMGLSPEDDPDKIYIPRHPDIGDLLGGNTDFTINQAVIELGETFQLTASSLAISACQSRIIQVTEGRVEQTESFRAGGEDDIRNWKKYLRNRTNMPARAAYFVATLRAAGFDFGYDLLDHARPDGPAEAHTFFLGLMVNKALQIDEVERGPGDTTATRILFDLYGEMGLVGTDTATPSTPEQIAAFCESVNEEHPQLKFYGSEVAGLVKHTDKEPAPRIV